MQLFHPRAGPSAAPHEGKIHVKKFACASERMYHITHTWGEIKLAQAHVVLT